VLEEKPALEEGPSWEREDSLFKSFTRAPNWKWIGRIEKGHRAEGGYIVINFRGEVVRGEGKEETQNAREGKE